MTQGFLTLEINMNETDITTIEELAEFMEAEAALSKRHDSEQLYVNGEGIRRQWHERINFPFAIFYLVGREADENDIANDPFPRPDGVPKVIFEIKSMWFDIDGNKTDRPCGNEGPLYYNE